MATKQEQQPQKQPEKKAKKKVKSLRDVLPTRGFEFRAEQPVLANSLDAYAFKSAMHEVTNNLDREEVDRLLAGLVKKAKEVKKPGATDHTVAFEEAGKKTAWTAKLKKGSEWIPNQASSPTAE